MTFSQRAQLQRLMEGASEHLQRGTQVALPSAAERLQTAKVNQFQKLAHEPNKVHAPTQDSSFLSQVNLECNTIPDGPDRSKDVPSSGQEVHQGKTCGRRSRSCGSQSNSKDSKVRGKHRPVFKGGGSNRVLQDEFPLEFIATMDCTSSNLEKVPSSAIEQSRSRTKSSSERSVSSAKRNKKRDPSATSRGEHSEAASFPLAFGIGSQEMHDGLWTSGSIFDGSEVPAEMSVSSSFLHQSVGHFSQQSSPAGFERLASSYARVRGLPSTRSQTSVVSAGKATTDYVNICHSAGIAGNSPAQLHDEQPGRPRRFLLFGQDKETEAGFDGGESVGVDSVRPTSAGSIHSHDFMGRRGGPLKDFWLESSTTSHSLVREMPKDLGVLMGSPLASPDPLLKKRSAAVKQRASSAARLSPGIKFHQKTRMPEKAHHVVI